MFRFYRYKKDRKFYDKDKRFYVCSFGGCGSQMLCHYLGHFGDVYHIHSRVPPPNLTNTGYDDGKTYAEWFSDIDIPANDMYKYTVIFIYRNPIDVIYSRLAKDTYNHLTNIQTSDNNKTLKDCVREKKDVFELEEFFDNYVTNKNGRTYPIYCVKYETFFDNLREFNRLMKIPPYLPELYPVKQESEKTILQEDRVILEGIYQPLIEKMNSMEAIQIK